MAPIGEKDDKMGTSVGDDNSTDESQNLWANILSEVQSSSGSKLSSTRSVLVLGNNDSGKTTLIAKLQGVEEPRKGSGLEYYYIDVKDEYRDEQARLNVWCLDGDPSHTGLLKFALTEQNFMDSLVLLSASMTHPWSLMESLEKWVTILREHIDRLKIPSEKMQDYEQSLVRFFQEYSAPEEGHSTSAPPRGDSNPLHPSASTTDDEKVLLPLGENTLSQNLGIPIVVVVTKSDAISTLEKEHDYREEHFDFVQQHIRKFCLKYGAALLYSSVKEDRNCDLLYKYLVHRIYGFPFTSQAYVVEKDSVFVPSGWDNEKKISILYENMSSMKPDDAFEDVITKPVTRKPVQRDAEIAAEDEQVFLMKQQTQLSKQPQPGPQPQEGTPTRVQRTPTTRTPERTGASPNTPIRGKADGKAPAGSTSEGMLANFFNSLLNKKTGQPQTGSDSGAFPDKVSRDAAAELDRMTRGKKQTAETNSHDTSASGS